MTFSFQKDVAATGASDRLRMNLDLRNFHLCSPALHLHIAVILWLTPANDNQLGKQWLSPVV